MPTTSLLSPSLDRMVQQSKQDLEVARQQALASLDTSLKVPIVLVAPPSKPWRPPTQVRTRDPGVSTLDLGLLLRRTMMLCVLAVLAWVFFPDRQHADRLQLVMWLDTWLAAVFMASLAIFMGWLVWRAD